MSEPSLFLETVFAGKLVFCGFALLLDQALP